MALKPPVEVPQGAIRLNTDSQNLEFFAQDQWWEMATQPVIGSGRGIFGGWDSPMTNTAMDYIQIQTAGNAVDFGDAVSGSYEGSSGASSTRGVNSLGYSAPSTVDTIQYVTIATAGNAVDLVIILLLNVVLLVIVIKLVHYSLVVKYHHGLQDKLI